MASAAHGTQPLGPGLNKFGKVADIVIRRCKDQLPFIRVTVDRCKTEIAHVIGAATLIQKDIPIRPANSPVIEVVDHGLDKYERTIGDVALRVCGLSRGELVRDVSFDVHRGEIFGIAGLVGSGRTELLRAIFGADHAESGFVQLMPAGAHRNRLLGSG